MDEANVVGGTRAGTHAGGNMPQNGLKADVDERDGQHSDADVAQKCVFAQMWEQMYRGDQAADAEDGNKNRHGFMANMRRVCR